MPHGTHWRSTPGLKVTLMEGGAPFRRHRSLLSDRAVRSTAVMVEDPKTVIEVSSEGMTYSSDGGKTSHDWDDPKAVAHRRQRQSRHRTWWQLNAKRMRRAEADLARLTSRQTNRALDMTLLEILGVDWHRPQGSRSRGPGPAHRRGSRRSASSRGDPDDSDPEPAQPRGSRPAAVTPVHPFAARSQRTRCFDEVRACNSTPPIMLAEAGR